MLPLWCDRKSGGSCQDDLVQGAIELKDFGAIICFVSSCVYIFMFDCDICSSDEHCGPIFSDRQNFGCNGSNIGFVLLLMYVQGH